MLVRYHLDRLVSPMIGVDMDTPDLYMRIGAGRMVVTKANRPYIKTFRFAVYLIWFYYQVNLR